MKKLAILLLTVSILAYLIYPTEKPHVASHITSALESTCRIRDLQTGTVGTGVVLNTGYIITAAHVVNHNFGLPNVPKAYGSLVAEFFVPSRKIMAVEVAYCSMRQDFAILSMSEKRDGQKFSMRFHEVGEEVYTVGMMLSQPPVISKGVISFPVSGLGRASCYVARGNSGGGLFVDNVYCGVVVAIPYEEISGTSITELRQMAPDGRTRLREVPGKVVVESYVHGVCFYVPNHDIYRELLSINLDTFIRPHNSSVHISANIYAGLIHLVVILLVLIYVLPALRN